MKLKRILSGVFASVFILNLTANALVTQTFKNTYQIGNNTYYTSLKGTTSSGPQSANFIEYAPNSDVTPVVVYGNKLYGRSTIEAAKKYLEQQGYNVIGGINGDYYNLSSGIPSGLVMKDGAIISSDGWQQAVGFTAGGNAIIGRPGMNMRLYYGNQYTQINYYNKTRTTAGIYLLDNQLSAETKNTTAGTDIILQRLDSNKLSPISELSLKVIEIRKTNKSLPIADNQMVLTIDDKIASRVPDVKVGDTVKVITNVGNTSWNNISYAVGAKDVLIEDSVVQSGLSTKADPRSAVGIKADGTVVIYEVDGRQSSFSAGLSLAELAQEMRDLGCVSAVNLDGGGSSSFIARLPGFSTTDVVNKPSDGSLRANANFIMFVNNAPQTSILNSVAIYPENNLMLLNATINLNLRGVDSAFYPAPLDNQHILSANGVPLDGTTYTANSVGDVVLEADYLGNISKQTVKVLDRVDTITVKNQATGANVDSLFVGESEKIDLTVSAGYKYHDVKVADNSFKWQVTGNIGTITQDGVFTANNQKASGSIILSYGNYSSKVIPVSTGLSAEPSTTIIEDFETINSFNPTNAQTTLENVNVANGKGSLKVNYNKNATLVLEKELNGNEYINFKFKGDGSNNSLYINYLDENDEIRRINAVNSFENQNFVSYSIKLPSGAKKFIGFGIDNTSKDSGEIYLDNVLMSAVENDNVTPSVSFSIANETAGTLNVSGNISKKTLYFLAQKNMQIYVNGVNTSFTYDTKTGNFSLKATNSFKGTNRITIKAYDNFGNLSIKSQDILINDTDLPKYQDISSNWAKSYINYADKKGYVQGEALNNLYYFNPNRNLTRAEFAVIIARYLNLDTTQTSSNIKFDDASSIPNWALSHIYAVANANIMTGSLNNNGTITFNPNQPVSRAEVVTVLGRTLNNGFYVKNSDFADKASIPSWSAPYFNKLVSLNILNGYEDNTIRPLNNITRAEITKLLYTLS